MSGEVERLFRADQRERENHPPAGSPEYDALRARDAERRARVAELLAAGEVSTGADHYHAAMIFQHGETPDDIDTAHRLARRAVDLGYRPARWLAAASLDRWLMTLGRAQKYGTQFAPDGTRWRLWDVEPATTDADRLAWDVPSLADQLRRAEELTRTVPQPPMDAAPAWLTDAVRRWAAHEDEDRT
ncbi:hypothetical protein R8Z50_35370 [Longispora sp. K20-0274]|uniref:hypothetical protein n=1 Tax=Longispora sp. K20-0274 TaxID=3088255 RepID=UPI00399BFC04